MQISCIFGTAYYVHISAYFNLPIMAYLPFFQAYFSIFKLIMPSKANQFNKYSTYCGRATRQRLLSPTLSLLSENQSSSDASEPRQMILSWVRLLECFFLMPLVLYVFSESLFHLVVMIMCNLPELVHFAPRTGDGGDRIRHW